MKTIKFILSFIVFSTLISLNQGYSQASNDRDSPTERADRTKDAGCSSRTADHFNDKNVRGEGLERAKTHGNEGDRAEKAARDCRDRKAADRAGDKGRSGDKGKGGGKSKN